MSSFFHQDGLGSTRQLTNAAGTVTDGYSYDSFGNVTGQTGTTFNPSKYVGSLGYYADGDSGLMLLQHRYYDPGAGRFITLDPIKDGINWYAYCGNDPVNGADPSGLWTADCGVGGTVIIPGFGFPSFGCSASAVLTIDGCWNVGVVVTVSYGWGCGAGFTAGMQLGGSNCPDISGLGGWFDCATGFGGLGPIGIGADGYCGEGVMGFDYGGLPLWGWTFGAGGYCGDSWSWTPHVNLHDVWDCVKGFVDGVSPTYDCHDL